MTDPQKDEDARASDREGTEEGTISCQICFHTDKAETSKAMNALVARKDDTSQTFDQRQEHNIGLGLDTFELYPPQCARFHVLEFRRVKSITVSFTLGRDECSRLLQPRQIVTVCHDCPSLDYACINCAFKEQV